MKKIIAWAKDLVDGQTRFIDIGPIWGQGALRGPEELERDLEGLWNAEGEFELIYAQIAKRPLGRREAGPHAQPDLCPWRKTIILTDSDEIRVEGWEKIYGLGSKPRPAERFRTLQVAWTVTLFARQKLKNIPQGSSAEAAAPLNDDADSLASTEWIEGVTDEGLVYFTSALSGETRWEVPADWAARARHGAVCGRSNDLGQSCGRLAAAAQRRAL